MGWIPVLIKRSGKSHKLFRDEAICVELDISRRALTLDPNDFMAIRDVLRQISKFPSRCKDNASQWVYLH